jgi:hypothetical protein
MMAVIEKPIAIPIGAQAIIIVIQGVLRLVMLKESLQTGPYMINIA